MLFTRDVDWAQYTLEVWWHVWLKNNIGKYLKFHLVFPGCPWRQVLFFCHSFVMIISAGFLFFCRGRGVKWRRKRRRGGICHNFYSSKWCKELFMLNFHRGEKGRGGEGGNGNPFKCLQFLLMFWMEKVCSFHFRWRAVLSQMNLSLSVLYIYAENSRSSKVFFWLRSGANLF